MIELRPVRPGEARGNTRAVFEQLREAIAVPWVPSIFQAFAMYPAYLELCWQASAPRLRSRELLDEAERIRAAAVEATDWYRPAFVPRGDRSQVVRVLDAFLVADTKVAILAAAYRLALEGALPPGPMIGVVEALRPEEERALATVVQVVRPDRALPELRRLYDDIEQALGLPMVALDYQALAAFPGALEAAWPDLRLALGALEYRGAEDDIASRIDAAARRVGLGRPLDRAAVREAGLTPAQVANLSALIYMFRRLCPGLCLQVAMLRRGFAG